MHPSNNLAIYDRVLLKALYLILGMSTFSAQAFFNMGVDVEGRMLASAETSEAYYAVLGTGAGVGYARLSNPKKIDVYASPVDWRMPWKSALFKIEFNCSTGDSKMIKVEYFTERDAKGNDLPASMMHIQKDIVANRLPASVMAGVYRVACVR